MVDIYYAAQDKPYGGMAQVNSIIRVVECDFKMLLVSEIFFSLELFIVISVNSNDRSCLRRIKDGCIGAADNTMPTCFFKKKPTQLQRC
jgi:hypothetical protein